MTAEITGEPVLPVQMQDDSAPDEAPYGYMTDPGTGEKRPRKRPGRRPRGAKVPSGPSPALDQLQALGTIPEGPEEDTAPGAPPKGRRAKLSTAAEPLPPFRAGPIAKWVNTQYRRVGRIVRMMDRDIGTAIIACTKRPPAEDDDEDTHVTVGEAWEEVAKNNPRIRRAILNAMAGGSVMQLFWAHAPIFLAIAMKDSIRSRLPLMGFIEAMAGDDGDDQDQDAMGGMGGMFAGLRPEDMAQMMAMGEAMVQQMANGVPRPPNGRVPHAEQGMPHPADGE